ncbi:YdcF family protein [Paenibacillus rhizophilus]|uniref:YdcF family protein n=1 Tax=Paenibacillus rhizophilus TaxID=1850366 RepID=A0A3N9PYS3_9BACL|nr:YdcF family protein [Paenibacillus rhizophilus]RQW11562.1 YdcF family protein [Paenibacillus rhizophilus]
MIYVIKFIYSFVLPPGIFILLLTLLALWMLWKKQRGSAGMLLVITLLLYFASIPLVSDPLMRTLESKYAPPAEVQGDCLVVLGGGATQGTPDVDGEGNLGGSAANRLITAVRLHHLTGLPVLFSGGQVFADSGNEGDIARRQLIGLGVDEQNILIENRSLNTEQNAEYTVELLKEQGLSRPVLVTSAFHMPRAVAEFRRAGMEVQPYPTDYHASAAASASWYAGKLAPSPGAIETVGGVLKEYIGSLAVAVKGH